MIAVRFIRRSRHGGCRAIRAAPAANTRAIASDDFSVTRLSTSSIGWPDQKAFSRRLARDLAPPT
jgi:hypothetical protein